ncbi:hypothetical protein LCGC14_2547960 [marine sediment metagenome]|uniref:Uncharacterized protein n=1 Tax=marine sediment metagenome TaxID=412755 RepID=A0A0F9ANS2_9ZZZZ
MSDLKYEFACSHDPCVCDDALRGPFLIHPHAGEDWQDFRGVIQIMLRDGGLVLDGRLQAIADAWKAYRESGGIRYDPTFEAVASALITAFEGEQP